MAYRCTKAKKQARDARLVKAYSKLRRSLISSLNNRQQAAKMEKKTHDV